MNRYPKVMSVLYGMCLLRVLGKLLMILYQSAWIIMHSGYHELSLRLFKNYKSVLSLFQYSISNAIKSIRTIK